MNKMLGKNSFTFSQGGIETSNQSVLIEQNKKKAFKTQCIVADSRHRNMIVFPNPAKYQVKFNASDTFQGASVGYNLNNVYSIQLSECLLPKGFEDTYPYLVLKIPELDNSLEGTSSLFGTAFAILIPDRIIGNTVHCRVNGQCYCFKEFIPTLSSLGNMTIEIYTPLGTLYDFKGSSLVDDPNIQNMMIFEIITKVLSRKVFNETLT